VERGQFRYGSLMKSFLDAVFSIVNGERPKTRVLRVFGVETAGSEKILSHMEGKPNPFGNVVGKGNISWTPARDPYDPVPARIRPRPWRMGSRKRRDSLRRTGYILISGEGN